MKKTYRGRIAVAVILAFLMSFGLFGCDGESATTSEKTAAMTIGNVKFTYPDAWTINDSSDEYMKNFDLPDGSFEVGTYEEFGDDFNYEKNVKNEGGTVRDELSVDTIAGIEMHLFSITKDEDEDGTYDIIRYAKFDVGDTGYEFVLSASETAQEDYDLAFRNILESVEIVGISSEDEDVDDSGDIEEDSSLDLTTEEQNAYDRGLSYLESNTFSRKGLIEQLEFEGYPTKVCKKAVDTIEENDLVSWSAEAIESAEGYLDLGSFSKEGLIEQLEFDGFTTKQARNAVGKVYK